MCQDACSSVSRLDVLTVNKHELVERCGTRYCDFSPHTFVRAFITVPRSRSPPVIVRSRFLRSVNVDASHADLLRADWSALFLSDTVSEK